MFGYIRAYKPDMRFREYETYKAVYCTLCRALGRQYSPLARLTLSYDFTFLALLHMSLNDDIIGYEQKRCVANPFKKCTFCKNNILEIDYAAAVALVLGEYKIRDNIADSGFFKSIVYSLIHPFFKSWRKKAVKRFPQLAQVVDNYEASQSAIEKGDTSSIDRAAEPTATALKQIFSMLSDDKGKKLALEQMGFCLGKWIYLMDVGADLEKDIKADGYNPLKYTFEGNATPIQYAEDKLSPTLNVCMVECSKAFELLDLKKYKPILENIIYMGLETCQKQIFSKEKIK
ncbi:MAG: DUF5685 family protein [Oscillospiraceae bacterium]|nr:DUF5685 family protein [Oscillospiraceae bacterium]